MPERPPASTSLVGVRHGVAEGEAGPAAAVESSEIPDFKSGESACPGVAEERSRVPETALAASSNPDHPVNPVKSFSSSVCVDLRGSADKMPGSPSSIGVHPRASAVTGEIASLSPDRPLRSVPRVPEVRRITARRAPDIGSGPPSTETPSSRSASCATSSSIPEPESVESACRGVAEGRSRVAKTSSDPVGSPAVSSAEVSTEEEASREGGAPSVCVHLRDSAEKRPPHGHPVFNDSGPPSQNSP